MHMRHKFCPKCGRSTEKFYDNLCRECFLTTISSVELPAMVKIKECKKCGKFFAGEKSHLTTEGAVENLLSNLLKRKEIKWATFRVSGNKVHADIVWEIKGAQKNIEVDLSLATKLFICRYCSQQISGYFNAILQIRNAKNLANTIEEINRQIKILNQKDNLAFVSKVSRLRTGIDIFIGSKRAAYWLANFLKKKYHAEIKISRKQYGFADGKQIFRDTILILMSD